MSVKPRILARDDRWMVVDKPAGWHTAHARLTDDAPVLEEWLAEVEPALATLAEHGLVHRLDRDTSGCVAVALDERERERLRRAFGGDDRAARVRKHYLALVATGLRERAGAWTLHFSSRYRRSTRMTVTRHGPGQPGTCAWRRLRQGVELAPAPSSAGSGDKRTSGPQDLLEIELVGPGRRHQVRAGFAAIGYPLAGDELYGGAAVPGRPGALLHAWKLEINGRVIESPPPEWARVEGDS